jgi:hypothetical protein
MCCQRLVRRYDLTGTKRNGTIENSDGWVTGESPSYVRQRREIYGEGQLVKSANL